MKLQSSHSILIFSGWTCESHLEASEHGMDSAPEGGRSQTNRPKVRRTWRLKRGPSPELVEGEGKVEVGEQGNKMSTSPGRDHRARNQPRRALFIRGWSTA